MIARPKGPPTVVLELQPHEAAALVRALARADQPVRDAGNSLDVERLAALRKGLEAAPDGRTESVVVEEE